MTVDMQNDAATAEGRPASIDNAIAAYYPFLRAMAYKLEKGNAEKAEAVLSDGIIDSLRRWRSYRPEAATVAAWVIWNMRGRQSRHRIAERRDRATFNRDVSVSTASVEGEDDFMSGVHAVAEASQHHALELKEVLEALANIPRSEILLRAAMGESFVEIGEAEGFSKQRAEQLTRRVRGAIG